MTTCPYAADAARAALLACDAAYVAARRAAARGADPDTDDLCERSRRLCDGAADVESRVSAMERSVLGVMGG